jgi:anti-anti-sigma factor
VAELARASLAFFAPALRCRNSAYFFQYSSFLRLDAEQNPRRDTAREFRHGLPAKAVNGMLFKLMSIEKQGIVHVASEGNLTSANLDLAGKNPLETLLGETWNTNRVLLNLSKTAYLDSCAVGWMIGTNRSFRDGGGKLVVYSLQPSVRQLLDVLKVGKAVSMVDGEEAARTALAT